MERVRSVGCVSFEELLFHGGLWVGVVGIVKVTED